MIWDNTDELELELEFTLEDEEDCVKWDRTSSSQRLDSASVESRDDIWSWVIDLV